MIRRTILRLLAFIERRPERLLYAALALLLLAGLGYAYLLGDALRFLPDEADYLALSQHLARLGQYTLDGQQPTAYRPPGYPLFLAPFQALGVPVFGLRWLNYVLLALTFWLLYRLLRRLASPLAGILGVLLSAGYGVLFFTAGAFYPQTLAGLLFIAVLARFLNTDSPLQSAGTAFSYTAAGLLLGWLILTVPTFVFILPLVLFWQIGYRKAWQGSAWMILLAVLCVGAWSVRHSLVLDAAVFVATNSGENLLLGNSPQTSANAGVQVDISAYRQQAEKLGLNEVERDRFYREQALAYWRSSPGPAFKLYLLKLLNYFNYRNNLATKSEASPARDFLMLVTYVPLLILAAWRLWASRLKIRPEEMLFAGLYFASALVHAVFFTRIRFRLPFDYMLILLASVFLADQLHRLHGKENAVQPSNP